ncbi:hypothetical protein QBC47DRAFT_385917 [Echria macrotheca]|uniref:Uncharacterized protein n=1 Tax=Echria macrotheca TaxID=438768 RepID=A0AAJ0BCD6_9PEZI|nr:hypothetical protein QBC47DRAFT_385917 [Echria macrotheca]
MASAPKLPLDDILYFLIKQPVSISYGSNGGLPPLGWRFLSLEQLEAKTACFTRKYGWEAYKKGYKKTSKGGHWQYYCKTGRGQHCKVGWLAEEATVEICPGVSRTIWQLCQKPGGSSVHNHDLTATSDTFTSFTQRINMIWVGMTAGDPIGGDDGVPISIYPEGHTRSKLNAGSVTSQLHRDIVTYGLPLGDHFVRKEENEGKEEVTHWTHESLILGLFIARQSSVRLQNTMSWEGDGAAENLEKALRAAPKDLTTVVMLGHLLRPKGPPSTGDFYKMVTMFAQVKPIRPFPNEAEWRRAGHKVGDLRLFDELAAEFNRNADTKWLGFRPKWCDGGLTAENCVLEGKTVAKKANSHGGNDVVVLESSTTTGVSMSGNRVRLCCRSPKVSQSPASRQLRGQASSKRLKTACRPSANLSPGENLGVIDADNHWFHEGYMPTLPSHGEYRVLMVRDTSLEALDGLVPPFRILKIVRSLPSDTGLEVKLFDADDDFSFINNPEIRQEKVVELQNYALVWATVLLHVGRYDHRYESYKVGCRLDIGITELSGKFRCWVNEPTNFFEAGTVGFSEETDVHMAWAKAFGVIASRGELARYVV